MKISKINTALMCSHKNVEKLARRIVNESSNAVLMEMFDDKCILADTNTGIIYESNYSFDGSKFIFENFNPIEIEEDNSSLKESIGKFFDDEVVDLTEAYEESSSSGCSKDLFEESLIEALASKNMNKVINYSELTGINEEIGEFKNSKLFKAYEKRLEEKPLSEALMFNWEDPVNVAMIDEDVDNVFVLGLAEKGKSLKTNKEFRDSLCEAISEAFNGETVKLDTLLDENKAIVTLDKAAMTELIGMSIIGNKELMENRKEAVNLVVEAIDMNDSLVETRTLFEEEATCKTTATCKTATASEETEASEDDCKEVISALEKALDKASDEKLKEKIQNLIDNVSDCKDCGATDVGAIKEAIALLRL